MAIALVTLSAFVAGILVLSEEGRAYVSHTPIRINSDSDFQIGVNGVVLGDGSAGNPYVISAWDIDAGSTAGIYIGNTTSYFHISNVYVHTLDTWPFYTGIHLYNVVNGRVSYSLLSGNLSYCMYIEQSSSILVEHNNMSAQSANAIYAHTVNGLTVSENDFYRCYGSGVTAAYSNNTVVSRNDFIQTRSPVYTIVSTNSTVHANQILGTGSSAVWIGASRNSSITDNNITNEFRGIMISGTSYDALVRGNNLTDIDYAIVTQNAARVVIRDNTIDDSDNAGDWGSYGSYGMYFLSMTNSKVWNNTMKSCGIGIYGQILADYNTHVISQNNTVNGRPVLYYRNQAGVSIDSLDVGQVLLANCSQSTCSNLQISDSDIGIVIAFSDGVTVRDCALQNNSYAQVLMRSNRNVNLSSSEFYGGLYGVLSFGTFASSSNISLYGCTVEGSAFDGFHLMYVTQASIMSSRLSGCGYYGAWLEDCSWGNITLSEFSNNTIGLYLDDCQYFKIWHNEFISNTHHAYDTYSNTWDDGYPSGGNYWDNYTGVDVKQGPLQLIDGSDGIGDTPLWLDPNSLDNYPLMQPIPEFIDIAVPIIAVLGLVLIARRRKDRPR